MAAVFWFHAQPSAAPGGFLGVTMFFALSGYLITSGLLNRLATRGRIGFGDFWVRRLKRLVPALAVLVVACIAYSQLRLDPPHDRQNTIDLLRGLVWTSNWFQYRGDIEPLGFANHLWSLAIEAQFYLGWPLILGLLWKLTNRPQSDRVRAQLVVLIGGAALGAAVWRAVLYGGADDHRRVYYGLDTNLDGLLLGATWAAASRCVPRVVAEIARVAAWLAPVALAGLAWMVTHLRVTDDAVFESGLFLANVATLVLIAAVGSGRGVARLLSLKPLVGIGVVSYAIYLWHWPVILVLNPYRPDWGNNVTVLIEAVVSLGLAVVSWFVVERRFLGHRRG